MEDSLIQIQYKGEEYELPEAILEKVIAACTLQQEQESSEYLNSSSFGYHSNGSFQSRIAALSVLKDGYESLFYQAFSEILIYAVEEGYFDSYFCKGPQMHAPSPLSFPPLQDLKLPAYPPEELNMFPIQLLFEDHPPIQFISIMKIAAEK